MYLSVKNIDLLQETEEINQDIFKSLRKKINISSEVMGEELKNWIV